MTFDAKQWAEDYWNRSGTETGESLPALLRRAHAAGRDEGLREAEGIAREYLGQLMANSATSVFSHYAARECERRIAAARTMPAPGTKE